MALVAQSARYEPNWKLATPDPRGSGCSSLFVAGFSSALAAITCSTARNTILAYCFVAAFTCKAMAPSIPHLPMVIAEVAGTAWNVHCSTKAIGVCRNHRIIVLFAYFFCVFIFQHASDCLGNPRMLLLFHLQVLSCISSRELHSWRHRVVCVGYRWVSMCPTIFLLGSL